MFRVIKILNNNGVLALKPDNYTEVIILGKGIGFGKKINERFEDTADAKIYELKKDTDRGSSFSLVQKLEPVYLEIAAEILQTAKSQLGELDENILLPLADHIAFAVQRIRNNGVLVNPMTQDVKALFEEEFKAALEGKDIILKKTDVELNDDELSYIALHLHSARGEEKLSEIMKQTQLIHECISRIEKQINISLDADTIAYNRLLSHMKYMLIRMEKGEKIELDMNAYIEHQYPDTYEFAKGICELIEKETGLPFVPEEIGYLAIHIERVRGAG